jgi:hypothetical protein
MIQKSSGSAQQLIMMTAINDPEVILLEQVCFDPGLL